MRAFVCLPALAPIQYIPTRSTAWLRPDLQATRRCRAPGLRSRWETAIGWYATAIDLLARSLVGLEINELMADFGVFSRRLADDPTLRWLGPHKGVVHLALASLTNACFDLWAKSRGIPLWKLLLNLTPEEVVATLDLSYVEDALSEDDALAILAGKCRNSQSSGTHTADADIQATTPPLVGWRTTTKKCANSRRAQSTVASKPSS